MGLVEWKPGLEEGKLKGLTWTWFRKNFFREMPRMYSPGLWRTESKTRDSELRSSEDLPEDQGS